MYCRTTKFEMRKTALQNTLTLNNYSSNGKQTAERLLTYQVSRCFTVVWSQFWTLSNFLSALETTTNNQEVKRSLHRLQNVNNLPKDYIRVCLTCRSLAELFNFIGLVEIQEYISSILKQSLTEYINKFKHIANKIFDFLLCFKGIRCNKLEIDFNIAGRWLGHLDLVTHPDMNPVQPSLTLVNRREPVFSKGNSHQVFCYISFSNDEQFSSKFFEESFFCVPNYISISLQVTSPRTMKTTSLTRIYSKCLQSFIPE